MSDYNTQRLHHRQAEDDTAEKRSHAIESRAVDLMKHGEECDPLDGFNICEAYGEATTNEKMVMGKMLAERKFDQAGILLDMISRNHWAKQAIEKAEETLE